MPGSPTSMRARERRKTAGQALVEFALILPVLITMTLGVVDLARVFTSHIALRNAVREGAMYAVVYTKSGSTYVGGYTSSANILSTMQQQLAGVTLVSVRCSQSTDFNGAGPCPNANSAAVSYVEIKATYSVSLYTPVIASIIGGSANLAETGVYPIFPKP